MLWGYGEMHWQLINVWAALTNQPGCRGTYAGTRADVSSRSYLFLHFVQYKQFYEFDNFGDL